MLTNLHINSSFITPPECQVGVEDDDIILEKKAFSSNISDSSALTQSRENQIEHVDNDITLVREIAKSHKAAIKQKSVENFPLYQPYP